jgi:hypothetical protein
MAVVPDIHSTGCSSSFRGLQSDRCKFYHAIDSRSPCMCRGPDILEAWLPGQRWRWWTHPAAELPEAADAGIVRHSHDHIRPQAHVICSLHGYVSSIERPAAALVECRGSRCDQTRPPLSMKRISGSIGTMFGRIQVGGIAYCDGLDSIHGVARPTAGLRR